MNQMILSICIPTYNGGERLRKVLDYAIRAINGRKDIEVLVSDNASTDNSLSIIREYESRFEFIHGYHNKENLGFNGNLIKLIDEYASGYYCWTIGDDDFIDKDAIDLLYPHLKGRKIDYLAIGIRFVRFNKLEKESVYKNRVIDLVNEDYFECIEDNAYLGNVLGTCMSTHIFKLADVKSISKNDINTTAWNSFSTVFPNSYLMLKAFGKSERCYYISNALISCLDGGRSYSNKGDYLSEIILPEYLEFFNKEYQKQLKKNKLCIYNINIKINIKRILRGDLAHFKIRWFLSSYTLKCLRVKKYQQN